MPFAEELARGVEPLTYGLQNGRRWFSACRDVSLSKVVLRLQCRHVSLDGGVGRVFGRQNGRQKHRFRRPSRPVRGQSGHVAECRGMQDYWSCYAATCRWMSLLWWSKWWSVSWTY